MLSIICEVDFKESNDPFRQSKTYSHLMSNSHLENISSNHFFQQFIDKIVSENVIDHQNLSDFILENLELNKENKQTEQFELVSLAISCLQTVIFY